MTADDFLTLLLAITIILLGVATMADYIRYRDGMRRDIALAFAPLTVLVIGGILADIFHTPWFEGLGVLFLVAHPYLMLRLVVYFRQVPKNIIRFALFGMVYTGVMYLLYVDDPPPIPALVAVSYFFGIDGYSMFAFIRGAMTAPGIVTRRRLRLAAVGAGLLALTPWLTPLIGTIALISFYVGFAPPRGLRRMWQWKELERLLLLLSSRTDAQTKDGVYRNLIQTATEAVGGSKTVFLLWQTSADDWMLIGDESNERPQTIALDNENIIQQVWQTRTPISVKAQEVLIEKNAHDESASIALIVPLARGERKWGLLLTFLQHGSLFPEDDLNLLGIFAEQSAIVLENVELLDETRQHARQLEGLVSQRTQALRQQNMYVILLQQIAVTANESTTIDSALQRAIDLICEHIKFPVGHAFAPSGTDSKTLVSQSVWRLDHSDTFEPFRKATHDMTFSSDLGVIGEVMAEGKPKLITNLTEDTNFIRREAAKAANLHSGLFVPVFSGETVVAVLEFLSDLYIVPDESLLEVMVHIGAQLGRVIERTQAQEALHESEARLAGMIESAMDAIITIDEDQRVLLFNRAAEEMFQYPSEEMLNGPLERLIPEEFRARHHQHIHKFGATGVTNRQMGALDAIRGLRANGDEFPIEASISQVEIRGHKYFTVILRDITERKLADEALRESEERQRMVNELISDYAFSTIVNADGSYGMDWLTGSFTRVTGYDFNDRERFKDNPSIYHPDDQQQVLDDIERVKQCETVTGEYRIVKPDGKIRWLEITRRPVWDDAEGRVVKFFGAAQDITERKKAEDALKESEGRYRLLAENSSDMISLHEPEGEFVYVSPAIEKLLGYKADEMIGVNPYTLFHPDDIERIRIESHDRALEGVTLNRVEYRMKTAKGDYTWLESATQPIIEDGEVVGLVSVTATSTSGNTLKRRYGRTRIALQESFNPPWTLLSPSMKISAFSYLTRRRKRCSSTQRRR
jgi:PAS domain S-box-containing protein